MDKVEHERIQVCRLDPRKKSGFYDSPTVSMPDTITTHKRRVRTRESQGCTLQGREIRSGPRCMHTDTMRGASPFFSMEADGEHVKNEWDARGAAPSIAAFSEHKRLLSTPGRYAG